MPQLRIFQMFDRKSLSDLKYEYLLLFMCQPIMARVVLAELAIEPRICEDLVLNASAPH